MISSSKDKLVSLGKLDNICLQGYASQEHLYPSHPNARGEAGRTHQERTIPTDGFETSLFWYYTPIEKQNMESLFEPFDGGMYKLRTPLLVPNVAPFFNPFYHDSPESGSQRTLYGPHARFMRDQINAILNWQWRPLLLLVDLGVQSYLLGAKKLWYIFLFMMHHAPEKDTTSCGDLDAVELQRTAPRMNDRRRLCIGQSWISVPVSPITGGATWQFQA